MKEEGHWQVLTTCEFTSAVACVHDTCHSQELGTLPIGRVLVHWYFASLLKLMILIHFKLKHLSVLPGNTLYFSCVVQFYLLVCIGLPCYKMDQSRMDNQSLHIKCRGHLIGDEGVQVGPG